MNRLMVALVIAVILLAAFLFIGLVIGAEVPSPATYVPGRLIVKVHTHDAILLPTLLATGRLAGLIVEFREGMPLLKNLGMDRYLIALPDGMSVEAGMLALEAEVEWAEPDYIWTIDTVPNDTYYGSQYHHQLIGSEAAWDVTTGDPFVILGIIDTGIDTHSPDLAPKLAGGDDFFNAAATQFPGGWDTHYHGSHVAGIAAGIGNNGWSGAGICWGCSVWSGKGLGGSGSGPTSALIQAIDAALAAGAKFQNASWGGGAFSQALLDSLQAICDADGLFITAAGNSARDTDITPHYPSSYDLPCIISVCSTDATDNLSSFSNYGAITVDLCAPGSSILSLPPPHEGSQTLLPIPPEVQQWIRSGTSMAAPMVTGAVGLVASANPGWGGALIRDAIFAAVDLVPALAGKSVTGGRLRIDRALGVSPPDPNTPPAAFCGDMTCNADETCATCAEDCGACPPICGNGICEPGEYCGRGKKIPGKVACPSDCRRGPHFCEAG